MKLDRLSDVMDENSRLLKQVEAQMKENIYANFVIVLVALTTISLTCWSDRFDSVACVLFGVLLPLQLYAGLIKEWEMTGASKTLFSCSSVRNVFLWGGISRVIQWLQTFNGHCEVS